MSAIWQAAKHEVLQWGRLWYETEISFVIRLPTSHELLQWGRLWYETEMGYQWVSETAGLGMLQWGRLWYETEIRRIAVGKLATKKASMGPSLV